MLYEMMCLRLPFDGSSMKQLCHNIIHANPSPPSSTMYSIELRDLVKDLLMKNPKVRPGINSILSKPIIRVKIASLLGATKHQAEFSHTILHGLNVLKDNNNIGAPPTKLQLLLPRVVEVVKPYPSDDSRQQPMKKVEPVRVEDIELEKWKARREAEKLRVVEEEKQKARRVEAEKLKLMEEAKIKARRVEAEKLQLYQMERLRVHREAEKLKVIEEERLKVRKEADRIRLVVEGRNKIKLDAERMQQMEIDRLKARREAEKMRVLAEEKLKVRREADRQLRLIAEAKQKARKQEAEKLQQQQQQIEVEKLKARRDAEVKLRAVEEEKIKARKEADKLRMVAEEEKQKVRKGEAERIQQQQQIQAADKIKARRDAEKQLRLMEEEKVKAAERLRVIEEGKQKSKKLEAEKLRVIEEGKQKAKKVEAERLQQIEKEKLKAQLHAEKLNSESEIGMKNPPSDENQPIAQIIVPKNDRNSIIEAKDDFSLTNMFSEMGKLQNQMKLIKQIKLPLKSKQPEPTASVVAAAIVVEEANSKPLLVSKSDNSLVIESMRRLVSKDQASIDQNRDALINHNNNNKIVMKDTESLVSPSRDAMKLQSKLKLEIRSKGSY